MTDDSRQESAEIGNGRDAKGRFAAGNPGGPGRPKGTRDALTIAFLTALHNEFDKRMQNNSAAVHGLSNEDLCGFISKVVQKETVMEAGDTFSDLLRRADELLAQRRT